ncbi:MAG TPA: hypothetical protein PK765_02000 [bacterium]|nr:hypothetical protein [bacterium]
MSDPVYAAVIGTLVMSRRYSSHKRSIAGNFSVSGFWQSVRNLFSKILP